MPVHSISPKLLLSALPGGSHRTRRLGHNQPETTRQLSVRLFDSSPRSQSDTLPDKSQVDIRSTNPYSGLWPCWTTRCMRCTWLKTYLSRFTYRLAILQYTKIRLLQLTYGCLDVYATCMASQLLESDTDCFVREFYTLEVCPDLKQQFSYAIWNGFPGYAALSMQRMIAGLPDVSRWKPVGTKWYASPPKPTNFRTLTSWKCSAKESTSPGSLIPFPSSNAHFSKKRECSIHLCPTQSRIRLPVH